MDETMTDNPTTIPKEVIPDESVVDPSGIDPSVIDPNAVPPSDPPIIYDIKSDVIGALTDFWNTNVKSHVEGSIQVFHSLTLGEAAICVLLAAILLIMIFKWIWEVIRYA